MRTDDLIERQITNATMRLQCAKTPTERRKAFAEMQRLHKLRATDPDTVKRLERERGLRG